ncbi:MAG: methyl-accepting chemotaxis protein [Geminocystis sp.]|nr:methyl-accepting chemotaxis protein [Geminocystis sp.]MCX8078936.1 methyl-accepting chemotaxis protein [Geminocystis sp.]MDW8116958.1 methyl-accepting chemotaxis protein [Geminocystis sp.]
MAIILGFVAIGVIFLLSRQLSKPIRKLAETATEFATGNMEVKAAEEGSWETVYLAQSFNHLVAEVKNLLAEKQKSLEVAENLAQMLQKQKQRIGKNLFILQGVVEEAAKGNLTVNAPLCEGEVGIVADFFNSIIESLRDIVLGVKESAIKVTQSPTRQQEEIKTLAADAIYQSEKIEEVFELVQQLNPSIQKIAENTTHVAKTASHAELLKPAKKPLKRQSTPFYI